MMVSPRVPHVPELSAAARCEPTKARKWIAPKLATPAAPCLRPTARVPAAADLTRGATSAARDKLRLAALAYANKEILSEFLP